MNRTTYRGTPKAGLYTRLSVDDGYVDRESNSITSQKQMHFPGKDARRCGQVAPL